MICFQFTGYFFIDKALLIEIGLSKLSDIISIEILSFI